MSSAWPPPLPADTTWSTIRTSSGENVRVRTARLWGRDIVIDERHRVWCDYCYEFVTVEELVQPDNSHGVGLQFPSGMALPMKDDDDPEPKPPSLLDSEW
jgi:hypothetical protein